MTNLLNDDNFILLENEELNAMSVRTVNGVEYWKLRKYTKELEKALNKACGLLEMYVDDEHYWRSDDWKEWCMKDE